MKHIALCLIWILVMGDSVSMAEELQFKLTAQSLEHIQKENIPEKTVTDLKKLENRSFSTQDAFLKAVEEVIGKEQTGKYQDILLKHASAQESLTKRASKWVTKNVISFGKDLSSGIGDGIDAGRKAATSADGAKIVSNYAELSKAIEISVIDVKTGNAQNDATVEMGFRNLTAAPVRITGLTEKNAVLLIDKDGFATGLTNALNNPNEITVPAAVAIRQIFSFTGAVPKAAHIRIFTKDIVLKSSK